MVTAGNLITDITYHLSNFVIIDIEIKITKDIVLHLTHDAVQYTGSPRFDYWNLLRRGWGLKIFWSILIFCRNFVPKGQKLICYSKKNFFSLFMIFLYFLGNLRGGHLYNIFSSKAPFFPHRPKKSPKKWFSVTFGCRK